MKYNIITIQASQFLSDLFIFNFVYMQLRNDLFQEPILLFTIIYRCSFDFQIHYIFIHYLKVYFSHTTRETCILKKWYKFGCLLLLVQICSQLKIDNIYSSYNIIFLKKESETGVLMNLHVSDVSVKISIKIFHLKK